MDDYYLDLYLDYSDMLQEARGENAKLRLLVRDMYKSMNISCQFIVSGVLIGVSPRAFHAFTCDPNAHEVLFLVGLHRILLILLFRIEEVAVTKFKETQVCILTLHVVLHTLQTTIEQGLTHHAKIA